MMTGNACVFWKLLRLRDNAQLPKKNRTLSERLDRSLARLMKPLVSAQGERRGIQAGVSAWS